MDLLQLKYFSDAAKSQNFSSTAKKFGVPGSDISQTISRLEKELGCKLFHRSANRIFLNEKGSAFAEKIQTALECIEDASRIAHDSGEDISGEVRLLTCTNRRLVTNAIDLFRKKYPSVSFVLSHSDTGENNYDLVISDDLRKFSEYEKELFAQEDILLAYSNDCDLPNLKTEGVRALAGQKFITMPPGSSLYRITKEICESNGFTPNIAVIGDDPYYLRKYISMGLGVAFVPSVSWEGQFDSNVNFYEQSLGKRKTYIFSNSSRYMTRGVTEFKRMLLESAVK